MPDGRLSTVAVTASNTWTQLYTVPAGKTAVANINVVNMVEATTRLSVIATSGSYAGVSGNLIAGATSSTVGFTLQEVFDINANIETMVMTNLSGSSLAVVTQSYTLAQYDYLSTNIGLESSSFREVIVPVSGTIFPFMPVAPISTSRKEHVAIGVRGMVFNTVYPRLSQSLARDYWYWQFQEPTSQPLPANISGSYRRIKYINGIHFILTNSGSYAVRDSDWQSFTLASGDFLDVDYNPTSSTYAFVGVSASLSTVFTSSVGTSSLTTPTFSQPSASGVFYTIDWVPPVLNSWYIGSTHGVLSSSNLTTWGSASISGAGVIVNSTDGNFLLTYLPTRDINIYAPANTASANVFSYLSSSRWITVQPSGANARITDAVEYNNTFTLVAGSQIYFVNPSVPLTQVVTTGPLIAVSPVIQTNAGNITLTKTPVSASSTVSQSIIIRRPSTSNLVTATNPPFDTQITLPVATTPPLSKLSARPFSYSSSAGTGPTTLTTSPGNFTGVIHEGMIVATSMPRVRKVHGLIKVNGFPPGSTTPSGSVVAIGRQNKMFDILSNTPYAYVTASYGGTGVFTTPYSGDLDVTPFTAYANNYFQNGLFNTNPQGSALFFMNKGPLGGSSRTTSGPEARTSFINATGSGPQSIDEHTHIIRYVQMPYFNYSNPTSASRHVSMVVIPKATYSSSAFLSTFTSGGLGVVTSSVLTPARSFLGNGLNSPYPMLLTTPSQSSGKYFLHSVSTASGAPKDTIFDYLPFNASSPWMDGSNAKFSTYLTASLPAGGDCPLEDVFVTLHDNNFVVGRTFNRTLQADERASSIQTFDIVSRISASANTPYNILPFAVGVPSASGTGIQAPESASGLLPLLVSTNLTGSAQVRLLRQHNYPQVYYDLLRDTYGYPADVTGTFTSSIIVQFFDTPWRAVASGSDVTANLIVSGGTANPVNFLYSRQSPNVLGIRGGVIPSNTDFWSVLGGQSAFSPAVTRTGSAHFSASALTATSYFPTASAQYIVGNTKLLGIARGFYEVSGSTGVIIFAESGSGRVSVSTDTGYNWTVANTGLPTEISTYVKLSDLTYRFFDQNMSASYTADLLNFTVVPDYNRTVFGNLEKWNVVNFVSSSVVTSLHSYIASDNGKVYRIIPSGAITPATASSGPPQSEYLEHGVGLSNRGSILSRKGEVLGAGISLQISASGAVSVNITGFEKSN